MAAEIKWLIPYLLVAVLPAVASFYPEHIIRLMDKSQMMPLLASTPYIAYAILAFMGYKLNRARILFTSVVLLASYYSLLHLEDGILTGYDIDASQFRKVLSAGVPLSLAIVFSIREGRFVGQRTLLQLAACVLPILALCAAFVHFRDTSEVLLGHYPIELASLAGLTLPYATWISLGLFGIALHYFVDDKVQSFARVTMLAMIPFMTTVQLGLGFRFEGEQLTRYLILSFVTMVCMQLHVLLRSFWKKIYLDELTGIPNRRALEEMSGNLAGNYTIAMVDVDHFKQFNDTHGHEEGDNVLRMVASILQRESQGRAFRYGGEEFTLIFTKTLAYENLELIEDIRRAVAERDFYLRHKPQRDENGFWKVFRGRLRRYLRTEGQEPVCVTVSIGVASSDIEDADPNSVRKRADVALYRAKEKGRNCVIVDEQVEEWSDHAADESDSIIDDIDPHNMVS